MPVVVGVGTVPRIRQPEILPHHHAIPVAGFVEFVVADLPHPVADHVEVHLRVVAHRGIVFARAIAQHRFAEAPIAALGNEAPAVDPHAQRAVVLAVGELPHARLKMLRCRKPHSAPFRIAGSHRTDWAARIRPATTISDCSDCSVCFTVLALRGFQRHRDVECLGRRSARAASRRPARRSDCSAWPPRSHRRGWYRAAAIPSSRTDSPPSPGRWRPGTRDSRCRFRARGWWESSPIRWRRESVGLSAPSAPPFLSVDCAVASLHAARGGGLQNPHRQRVLRAGMQFRRSRRTGRA